MKPQKLIKAIEKELLEGELTGRDQICDLIEHIIARQQPTTWNWPRATDADRGKFCWCRNVDTEWHKRIVLTHDFAYIEGCTIATPWDHIIHVNPADENQEPPASVLEESLQQRPKEQAE